MPHPDILDGAAAALCLAAFVALLVRQLGGHPVNILLLISMPIIALLALGRIAKRKKAARKAGKA